MPINVDETIADMFYLQLPTGGPTQADIWSNLPTGHGANHTCNGLIITPRCDFAHSKSPVLNYLPVVTCEHYLLSMACFPLLEQVLNDAYDALRKKAEALEVEHLLELGIPLGEVLDHAKTARSASQHTTSRQSEKAFREFEAHNDKICSLTELLQKSKLTLEEAQSVFSSKQFARLQQDVIKNNNSDTYFLPPCPALLEVPSVPGPVIQATHHLHRCTGSKVSDQWVTAVQGGSYPLVISLDPVHRAQVMGCCGMQPKKKKKKKNCTGISRSAGHGGRK